MKLAQSVKILDLQSIAGAERIETASVLGYKVVCQKGLYQVGQIAAFINPDTIIKRKPWSEFLFKGEEDKKDKVRLKVMRMRGQTSQGLLVPLVDVGQTCSEEGVDFTEALEVQKFEKSIECLNADAVGYMPSFLRKTDEDNLRSNVGALAELQGKEVYISTKVDGMSGTFFFNKGEFGVCSRKLQLVKTQGNSFWDIVAKYDLENKMRGLLTDKVNIAVQGECYGENIQGNKLGIKGRDIKVFDVWDIDNQKYLGLDNIKTACLSLELPMVDIIYRGGCNFTLDDLIKMANEVKYPNGAVGEGIVCRPVNTTYSEVLGRRLSVKVISEKFALKHGE